MKKRIGLVAALILIGLQGRPASSADKPPAPFGVRVVGTGRPMILIPGLGCSGDVWKETVDHFKDKFQCHVLTLAGFAGQPPREAPFIEPTKNAIVDYIREKRLDRPIIVGHSLGGFMTYLLGMDAPDVVGPLVSVDGLPCLAALVDPNTTPEQAKKRGDEMSKAIATATREVYLQRQRGTISAWISDEAKRDLVLKMGADSDQKTFATAMGELFGRDLRGDVAKVKGPFLLIAAPSPFPGMTSEELKKRYLAQVEKMPNKTVAFAEKSKHFVMYDEPQWMWEQIEKFVQSDRN
ncbi:MAG: alpha/beta fold hydrolase [Gemmataceae bacterium]